MNLIDVNNLTKIFMSGRLVGKNAVVAAEDVSFSIPEKNAKIVTLAGESGSGKTTIGRLILRLTRPTSGEVLFRGQNIWRLNKERFNEYRKTVQAVFQDPYAVFNPFYTADRLLKTPIRMFQKASSRLEEEELINKGLEAVGLSAEDVEGKYPHQLSGGQLQRVMLARALLLNVDLIVADEPVSMIDTTLKAGILKVILELRRDFGVSFIYITHDLSTAYHISDEMMILYLGNIVEKGPADDIVKEPLHPYTQLLINSVPVPDPKQRWKYEMSTTTPSLPEKKAPPVVETSGGCKFYDRCRKRTDLCRRNRPPMVKIEPNREVLCFLYSD
jgi:peptide/nickel transport system ATP-binding protein